MDSPANDDSSGGFPFQNAPKVSELFMTQIPGISPLRCVTSGVCDLCQKMDFYFWFIVSDGHHLIEHSPKRLSTSLDLQTYRQDCPCSSQDESMWSPWGSPPKNGVWRPPFRTTCQLSQPPPCENSGGYLWCKIVLSYERGSWNYPKQCECMRNLRDFLCYTLDPNKNHAAVDVVDIPIYQDS